MTPIVEVETSPSLALVKYWGKLQHGINLPATSNLAVGLDALRTRTRVELAASGTPDAVFIDDTPQPVQRFTDLFDEFRRESGRDTGFTVRSSNSFPTAAGIASSSSGFAALVLALDALLECGLSREELSALARRGSGSASRALFGGFTRWKRGDESASQFLSAAHWPELRVVIAVLSHKAKAVGSREAMERSRTTSAMYEAWVSSSEVRFAAAADALVARDLHGLGTLMRESYLAMFSTMFTAQPPVLYWLPESVAVIRAVEAMRRRGIQAWETMDAGPQVKIVTTVEFLQPVTDALRESVPGATIISTAIGGEPLVTRIETDERR